MGCLHPIPAFQSLTNSPYDVKTSIVFSQDKALQNTALGLGPYEPIKVACGKCDECKLDKSKEWAVRCVHEAAGFDHNCFITLTKNEQNISRIGTLEPQDFVKFMKRFRKHFHGNQWVFDENGDPSRPIRYFHCGEYGTELGRPHHHACIFNFDFEDKEEWKQIDGVMHYRSEDLERLWSREIRAQDCRYYPEETLFETGGKYYAKLGFCTVGEVNWKTAAYVARYVTKKVHGDGATEHYQRVDQKTGECYQLQPEYVTMSRSPGIGAYWLEQFKSDCYPKGFITVNGVKHQTPGYYDRKTEETDKEVIQHVKEERKKRAALRAHEQTEERLAAREKIIKQRLKRLVRGLENGTRNVFGV